MNETDERWRASAACRDEDPELFFPTGAGNTYWWQVQDAKRVCGRCPVTADCLQEALALNCDDGIWGGLEPQERSDIRLGRRYRPSGLH